MTQSVHEFLTRWGCAAFAEAVAAGAREVKPGRVPLSAAAVPLPSQRVPAGALLADLLADLPDAPPRCACQRGETVKLYHEEDGDLHMVWRRTCGGWGCPVCRRRNSHEWVTHLAGRVEGASDEGRRLYAAEMTRSRFDDSYYRSLHRRGAEWCALELLPGVLLVVMALPEGAKVPAGAEPTGLVEVCGRLVKWAKEVRTGDEPFSKRVAKMRPVRTSAGWRLNREEEKSGWKRDYPIDTREINDVVDVITRGLSARITQESSAHGEKKDGGSLVWIVQFRCNDCDEIDAGLRAIGSHPAKASQRNKDDPGYTPFEDSR